MLQRIRRNLLLQVLRELEEESKPQRAREVSRPQQKGQADGEGRTEEAPLSPLERAPYEDRFLFRIRKDVAKPTGIPAG